MPGRFANKVSPNPEWAELIKIWPDIDYGYNVSPGQTIAAFRSPAGKAMRWGLIPHWSKEFSSGFATFKAKLETIHEKPAFRDAWEQNQHCLIPMLGYYEWKGPKGNKQPYFIQAADKKGLIVAGIYDKWGSEGLYSCTMITRPAMDAIQHIHPRMPVVLSSEQATQWLSRKPDNMQSLLMELEPPQLINYPVNKEVANVLTNGKRLIEPIEIKQEN
jgi:putative SOS response-associated peptidase YedK